MSHSSENTLSPSARVQDVREFVELLGYQKAGVHRSKEHGTFEEYWWFDEDDYRSWSGVELTIYQQGAELIVSTRTTVSRSYFDLVHQNETAAALRKRFGGTFTSDAGKNRYLHPGSQPPPASASGCYLAFNRFGHNLIKAKIYHEARAFPNHPIRKWKGVEFLQELDPRTLANNTLVPFLVAALEDYFKSTFVALLRYSPRKEAFLKGVRLQGEQLMSISDGKSSVEDQISETMSFQRLSAICRHFETLDTKLDIAGALKRPYRRRKQTLYDALELVVSSRHELIHRAKLDPSMTDERIDDLIYDMDEALTRVYKRITIHYGWFFDRGWYLGRRRKKTAPLPVAA